MSEPKYWMSPIGGFDDFDDPYTDTMYDAKTNTGPWANMTEKSWLKHGGTKGRLGLGFGQKYMMQPDGRWMKVAG